MSKHPEKTNTTLIIDSFALIFRSYYAFPPTLTDPAGNPVNALYGFANLLIEVLDKFRPDKVIAVFDSEGPTIRKQEFSEYKSNRAEADTELIVQIPRIRELIEKFGIPVLNVDGYEADDIIGTLSSKILKDSQDIIIVTGDQDIFQLIRPGVSVYLAGSSFSKSKLYHKDDVFEKLGVYPNQIIDYKSLCGDASDNIPGVKGIGKKTTVDLLSSFGSLDSIYENIGNIKSKSVINKLANSYEIAKLSQRMATIDCNTPIHVDLDRTKFEVENFRGLLDHLENLKFETIKKRLIKLEDFLNKDFAKQVSQNVSMSLFDDTIETNEITLKSEFEFKKLQEKILDTKHPIVCTLINNQIYILTSDSQIYVVDDSAYKFLIEYIFQIEQKIITFSKKEIFKKIYNISKNLKGSFFDIYIAGSIVSGGRSASSLSAFISLMDVDVSNSAYTKDYSVYISLYNKFENEFQQNTKFLDLYQLEYSLVEMIVQMEEAGFSMNLDKLSIFEETLKTTLKTMEDEILEEIDVDINLRSPKQVGEALFEVLALPGGKKTKSGQYATNEKVLRSLSSSFPIVKKILQFREIDKLISTYILSLPKFIHADGKIHTTLDQLGAVSGRFSSNNPNMQNIPGDNVYNVNIRSVFESSKDSILVAFDYSQQELRILAAFAQDRLMLEAFNNNDDIHRLTASKIWNIAEDDVTSQQRSFGKTINFSVVYGVSPYGLSQSLSVDVPTASVFITDYYHNYPSVKVYYDSLRLRAKNDGYLDTILGRRRYSSTISSSNRFIRDSAERELLNFVIQGSAADIMKLAMANIDGVYRDFGANLLLQIHDEFVFELPTKSDLPLFVETIKSAMLQPIDIGVNYKVDVKTGKNWGELLPYSGA